MNGVLNYLNTKGYDVDTSYYTYIKKWIDIWKGKAEWLTVKTIDGTNYPMYTLNIAKRSCEDLASMVTSEPFTIKATQNDEILQKDLKEAKILENLSKMIEIMGYTGTVGSVARIINAEIVGEGETATLKRGAKTKIRNIIVKADQIIPLTFDNEEVINCAFVSKTKKKINGQVKTLDYMELHELEDRGYQITNKYFDETGAEIEIEGVLKTYNTLSQKPLFNLRKLEKENPIDNNNNLGLALYGSANDQLIITDLTYNNFGMDFKLGQKLLLINKKLTKIVTEEYTDKDGQIKERQKVLYPSDIQKQQFMDITDGVMGNPNENPYVYEYNPDLRVGDNKEGVQFALNTYSFEIGFGTDFYNFENGKVYTNTMSVMTSRKDLVDNMNKVRKSINDFLKGICQSLLLCEKILGDASINENQDIEVAEADGFMQDDETERSKLQQDYSMGAITMKRYLMKAYKMTEEEALKEIADRKEEDGISSINLEQGQVE